MQHIHGDSAWLLRSTRTCRAPFSARTCEVRGVRTCPYSTNEPTDWTVTSRSLHSPVTLSSRPVWTRSLSGSPMGPQCSHHWRSSCSGPTRATPAQRIHQRQFLLRHLQKLFELQEPEAELMLTVGLDFSKHSKSQLCPPLAQSRSSATSGHTPSTPGNSYFFLAPVTSRPATTSIGYVLGQRNAAEPVELRTASFSC